MFIHVQRLRIFALFMLTAAACGSEPDGPTDFSVVQERVFVPRCTDPACHDIVSQAGNLVLEGPVAYTSLTETPCANEAALAAGLVRVAGGDLDSSFLWIKLVDPQGMGDPMPISGALSDDELDVVRHWIEEGALPAPEAE